MPPSLPLQLSSIFLTSIAPISELLYLHWPLASSLASPHHPFIVGSAMGVERSEVARREGEEEAE